MHTFRVTSSKSSNLIELQLNRNEYTTFNIQATAFFITISANWYISTKARFECPIRIITYKIKWICNLSACLLHNIFLSSLCYYLLCILCIRHISIIPLFQGVDCIVLWADHGQYFWQHGCVQKCSNLNNFIYARSIRFIICSMTLRTSV